MRWLPDAIVWALQCAAKHGRRAIALAPVCRRMPRGTHAHAQACRESGDHHCCPHPAVVGGSEASHNATSTAVAKGKKGKNEKKGKGKKEQKQRNYMSQAEMTPVR